MRQTSVEAYNDIMVSGLLGKRQKDAYAVLYENGPLTGNELSLKMGIPGQWKRCSELKKRGLALEVGERLCSVTGRNCITWDVTDKLPTKLTKKETRIEKACREAYEKGFNDGVMSLQKQGRLF